MKIRKILFLLFVVTMLLSLSACTKSTKSEKEIAKEVAAQDSFFLTYALELESYSVEKRQTNIDDKNDLIWITITGHNDDFEYTANYKAVYILYNDGWLLEECILVSSDYVAVSEFDKNAFEDSLSQEYIDYQHNSTSKNKNSIDLTYTVVEEVEYEQFTYELSCSFAFHPSTLWEEKERTRELLDKKVDFEKAGQFYFDEGKYSHAINYLENIENPTEHSMSLLNIAYENLIVEIYFGLGYVSAFTVEDLLECISAMPQKTDAVVKIESSIEEFYVEYGKWIGHWVSDLNNSLDVSNSIEIYAEFNGNTGKLQLGIADAYNKSAYTLCSVDSISSSKIIYKLWTEHRSIEYIDTKKILYGWDIDLSSDVANYTAYLYHKEN